MSNEAPKFKREIKWVRYDPSSDDSLDEAAEQIATLANEGWQLLNEAQTWERRQTNNSYPIGLQWMIRVTPPEEQLQQERVVIVDPAQGKEVKH